MRDISDTNSNPIAAWVGKQIERGFKEIGRAHV